MPFEHPRDSVAWSMLGRFDDCLYTVDLHMCQFGLRIPGAELIRKPTRLKVSHADMRSLARRCPRSQHPEHQYHHFIAGSHHAVGSVSRFAGRYPPKFCQSRFASFLQGIW